MKKYVRGTSVLVVLWACSTIGYAHSADLGLSVGGGFTELKESTRYDNNLGKGAGNIDFRGELLLAERIYLAGGGLVTFYNDRNSFSQLTQNVNNGDTQDSQSTLSGVSGFFELGYHQPLSTHFYAGLNGGVLFTPNPKRSILNCTDCQVESVDIGENEPFIAPVVGYYRNPGFKVELEYRKLIGNQPFDQMALLTLGYLWRIKH